MKPAPAKHLMRTFSAAASFGALANVVLANGAVANGAVANGAVANSAVANSVLTKGPRVCRT